MGEIIDCTKCTFYNNGKCDNPNGMACNCANNAVCYFKEFKRLEQENAELKEKIKKYSAINEQETKDYAELKAENDKLKECNKELISDNLNTIQEMDNERRRVEQLKEEVETRDNLIDHFRDEALYRATIASEYQKDRTKLEQTLQEIKEIAEFHITQADSEDVQNDMKQIIDLITKAESEG